MGGLYEKQHWPDVQVWATYTDTPPPEVLVQSVHVVAVVSSGQVCVCEDEIGKRFLPGGTREYREPINDCADRELLEEAGLEALGPYLWFGAHRAIGYRDIPYRPYLPHPEKAWLWGVCDARRIGPPTNPPGAEVVTAVHVMSVREASEYLRPVADWYGELLERAMSAYARRV